MNPSHYPALLRIGLIMTILVIAPVLASCSPEVTSRVTQSTEGYEQQIEELWDEYGRDPAVFDAVVEAVHRGLTVEEVQRRTQIVESIVGLEKELETGEPETYGGLWIQHEDPFCIVVAFTENGEDTIRRYVDTELIGFIDIHQVEYSLAELSTIRDALIEDLLELGFRFDMWTDIVGNRVVISGPDTNDLDNDIEEGLLVIPDCVVIKIGTLATPE